jgi:hypothetical protein
VVNNRKPHVQTPFVSRYPAPAPVHDFVLLFLTPCGPHSTPLATGFVEPSLLVFPLLGCPAMHRPFALALHLHQRNQAATCTYNTQLRVCPYHNVNHSSQPVATIHRSSDAPVLTDEFNWNTQLRGSSATSMNILYDRGFETILT